MSYFSIQGIIRGTPGGVVCQEKGFMKIGENGTETAASFPTFNC